MLAWFAAGLIRVATGSAAVATITGGGLVAPIVTMTPDVNREFAGAADGCGLADAQPRQLGRLLARQQDLNIIVARTFRTWTMLKTILSVAVIVFIMILSTVV